MSSSPQPIVILGTGRSFTSVVNCMIGEHPDLIGLPETNIFRDDTVGALLNRFKKGADRRRRSGLLRTIAHFHDWVQTEETISAAEKFLEARGDWSYRDIAQYIEKLAAPYGIVEKSISTCRDTTTLSRVRKAWPDAFYIHITRQPENILHSMQRQIDSAVDKGKGKRFSGMLKRFSLEDYYIHYTTTILEFMNTLPMGKSINLHGEDFLSDAPTYLKQICEWMGLDANDKTIDAMLHPENNPFAHQGPNNARGGMSPSFLANPKFSGKPVVVKPLVHGAYNRDLSGKQSTIVRLSSQLGYT